MEKALEKGNGQELAAVLFDQERMQCNSIQLKEYVEDFKPDLIVCGGMNMAECVVLAEKKNIPLVAAAAMPAYGSGNYTPIGFHALYNENLYLNSFLNWFLSRIHWSFVHSNVNKLRKAVGLPPQNSPPYASCPHIHFFSPALFPPVKEWPKDKTFVSGYWNMPKRGDFVPLESLKRFVDSGDAPFYMGMGSMPVSDPKKLVEIFCEVISQLGMRGIFCFGHNEAALQANVPDNVLLVKEANHEWLSSKWEASFLT